jgi:acetyl esterase
MKLCSLLIIAFIALFAIFISQFYQGLGNRSLIVCVITFPLDALHWMLYYDFGRSVYRSVLDTITKIGGPEDINTFDVEIAAESGPMMSRIYKPSTIDDNQKTPVLVWVHGGGFILGSVSNSDGHVRRISKATNMIVVSVGYGLAPEHKFPTQVYDCVKTLRWVYEHIEEYGGDKSKIAVSGESAGGNLASALMLENAKSPNPVPLCAQGLVVPVVLAEVFSNSMNSYRNGYAISTSSYVTYFQLYSRSWEDCLDPRLSPLIAPKEDLQKLPPGIIITAEKDAMRDQGEAYANKLRSLDINITSFRANGTIHGFFARDLEYSDEAVQLFSETINHFCREN